MRTEGSAVLDSISRQGAGRAPTALQRIARAAAAAASQDELYEALKEERILVRYMVYDGFGDGLRISVGSDAEIDRLLDELGRLV